MYSSIVRVHESLGSRRACPCSEAGFSSQNDDRAWGVSYRRAAFSGVFCGQKDSMQRIFTEKCFLFVVRSVCRVKRFATGWQTFCCWRVWRGGVQVAETTVRRFLCWGFGRTFKMMGQVYQCCWRLCQEINVFFSSRFEYHMFYVSYPFVTYLLTLPT
jgi:hypothetical protein